MKHRKLRIAWSVAWGIVAILLIVFWVRSYRRVEAIWIVRDVNGENGGLSLTSKAGHVGWASELSPLFVWGEWQFESRQDNVPPNPANAVLDARDFDLDLYSPHSLYVKAPYWFPTSFVATLAAIPWLRWRFSLRTLLLATTLVAVGLGLIVWAAK